VRRPVNPRRDWFAGCVLGAWTGSCLVYFAIVGAVLIVGFAIGAAVGRSLAAIGGLLLGAGGVMILMLGLANWQCAQDNARANEGCTPPDLTGFLVAGASMALIGRVLTARAIVGSRRS
jgi:uncharacterized membrane protein